MPIQFPSNPTTGQQYTYSGIVYTWTGQTWRRTGASAIGYDLATTSTGYFDLPSGTTSQRPNSPPSGAIRYNSSTLAVEYYDPSYQQWASVDRTFGVGVSSFDIEYLVVAGGGGGGGGQFGYVGGGGGGGGGGASFGFGGTGGSGIVILKIPSVYTATFSAGLTTSANTTAVIGSRIYSVTAGTGTVTFST